jgi:nitronate monooxygenase
MVRVWPRPCGSEHRECHWALASWLATRRGFTLHTKRIVDATAEDTVLNELYDYDWPNAPHRTLRNKTYAEWQAAGCPPRGARPGEGTSIGHRSNPIGERVEWMRYSIGTPPPDFDGDIEYAPLWAGVSVSNVNDILPAAEIIRSLVRDAEAALSR